MYMYQACDATQGHRNKGLLKLLMSHAGMRHLLDIPGTIRIRTMTSARNTVSLKIHDSRICSNNIHTH